MEMNFYGVKVLQDDEGNWWLEYWQDEIRYGFSISEIHAAQHCMKCDPLWAEKAEAKDFEMQNEFGE